MIQFGRYLLLERLAEGSQGEVHLAHPLVGAAHPMVIKRLGKQHRGNHSFILRFRHEASIAMAIDSPNVVKVLDAGQVGEWFYIAMEYVAGRTLAKVLMKLAQSQEHPSLASIADVMTGALAGLHALHTAVGPDGAGLEVVHRDVAPKNLMLSDEGITKVIDLGLGKSKAQDWRTATGIIMGTPGYLAPEMAAGGEVDRRADIFAMGVILFELLTLRRYLPIRPVIEMLQTSIESHYRPPSSIRPDVPQVIDEIVRRALELDPERRFQSAQEMADAIREVIPIREEEPARSLLDQLEWNDVTETKAAVQRRISDSISTLRSDSSAPSPPPPPKRSRSISVVIGAVVLLLVGAVFGWSVVSPPHPIDAKVIDPPREDPPAEPAAVQLPVSRPEVLQPPPRAKEKRVLPKRIRERRPRPGSPPPASPPPPPVPQPSPILDVEI